MAGLRRGGAGRCRTTPLDALSPAADAGGATALPKRAGAGEPPDRRHGHQGPGRGRMARPQARGAPAGACGARFTWRWTRARSKSGPSRAPEAISAMRPCCRTCSARSPRASRSDRSPPTGPATPAAAATPSRAEAPMRSSRPAATPRPWKTGSPAPAPGTKPCGPSNGSGGRSGDDGAGITASGRAEATMNCVKLLGRKLAARDSDRQAAELQVRLCAIIPRRASPSRGRRDPASTPAAVSYLVGLSPAGPGSSRRARSAPRSSAPCVPQARRPRPSPACARAGGPASRARHPSPSPPAVRDVR